MDEIVAHAQHMMVPEGTMLMDVGQQMEAIPLLLSGAIKIMRVDQDGDEILIYFLESGDSCALSMGTYMGASKSSIRAVTEQETSLLMVPVAVGQSRIKNTRRGLRLCWRATKAGWKKCFKPSTLWRSWICPPA